MLFRTRTQPSDYSSYLCFLKTIKTDEIFLQSSIGVFVGLRQSWKEPDARKPRKLRTRKNPKTQNTVSQNSKNLNAFFSKSKYRRFSWFSAWAVPGLLYTFLLRALMSNHFDLKQRRWDHLTSNTAQVSYITSSRQGNHNQWWVIKPFRCSLLIHSIHLFITPHSGKQLTHRRVLSNYLLFCQCYMHKLLRYLSNKGWKKKAGVLKKWL